MLRPETSLARALRREMSLPEILLWQCLRTRPAGIKFRRQHPIGPYVADFYCSAARLAVEIDGAGHDGAAGVETDGRRDRFMAENGYTVLRLSASQVLMNPDAAADIILSHASRPLHHGFAAVPLPASGEDRP